MGKKCVTRQIHSLYPALYRFCENFKYGQYNETKKKINKDAEKLYHKINTLYEDVNNVDDDEYRAIIEKFLSVPIFVEWLPKFWEHFDEACIEENLIGKLRDAYTSDQKIYKQTKEIFCLVMNELESLPPSKLISEGGIEFQKAENRYNTIQNSRTYQKVELSSKALDID